MQTGSRLNDIVQADMRHHFYVNCGADPLPPRIASPRWCAVCGISDIVPRPYGTAENREGLVMVGLEQDYEI